MVDAWESGDKIGISTVGLTTDYFNVGYKATTSTTSLTTTFAAIDSSNEITYPDGFEGEVTFIAYYPYDESITADTNELEFFLSESDGEDNYFLVAATTKDITSEDSITDIGFNFVHIFATLQLNITFTDDSYDLSDIDASAEIYNVSSYAIYDIDGNITSQESEDGMIWMPITVDEESKTGTATTYLHPGSLCDDTYIKVIIDGFIYNIDYTKEVLSGERYTLNIEI